MMADRGNKNETCEEVLTFHCNQPPPCRAARTGNRDVSVVLLCSGLACCSQHGLVLPAGGEVGESTQTEGGKK